MSLSSVAEGEVLGVIGRNGAGKSTLLKILTRITTPTEGRAEIRGRVGSLLEVGTGFHPELTGRENVYLNGSDPRDEAPRDRGEVPTSSSSPAIEQFIDTPVKRYSSGMYVRLAFCRRGSPRARGHARGRGARRRRRGVPATLSRADGGSRASPGRTVIFVSHNMQAISQLCDRALLARQGRDRERRARARMSSRSYLQSGHRRRARAASGPISSGAR